MTPTITPAGAASSAVPPPQPTGAVSLDDLQGQIKAAHQEALAVQAAIRELKQRETELSTTQAVTLPEMPKLPELPATPDLTTLAPGLVVLLALMGASLWWFKWRPHHRFAQYDDDDADPPESELHLHQFYAPDQPDPIGRTIPDLDLDEEDGHSVGFESSHGGLDESTGQRRPTGGFNSESAAVDVHRVRESLAQKRAMRAQAQARHASIRRASMHGPLQTSAPTEEVGVAVPEALTKTDIELDLDPTPTPSVDLRLDLDLDLEVDATHAEPRRPLDAPAPAPTLTTDEDAESPGSIKFALAQEFLSLGLLEGAEDLARELVEGEEVALRDSAFMLLGKIQEASEAAQKNAFDQAAEPYITESSPTDPTDAEAA